MTGRRALAFMLTALLAIALLAPSVLAAGVTSASDSFDEPIYSGGSGWIGDWTETGETTNPSSGVIQVIDSACVETNCVQFSAILTLGVGLQRSANFEGAEKVSLIFRYRKAGVGNLEVRARTGSGSWDTVDTLGNSDGYTDATVDLSDYASPTVQIMFFSIVAASAYIDNVSITASYPTTTPTPTTSTTTTTTEPIITVPTIPPILTTTTTTTSAASSSTTTVPGTSTTTTTPGSGSGGRTDDGSGGGSGGGESPDDGGGTDQPPPDNPGLGADPLTPADVALAQDNNIAVDLVAGSDFPGFGSLDINPLTGLAVRLQSTVETISSEFVSALLLGGAIAFFAVRRIKEEGGSSPRS